MRQREERWEITGGEGMRRERGKIGRKDTREGATDWTCSGGKTKGEGK